MDPEKRVPIFARLRPEDKAVFVAAAKEAGIEPAIGARMLLELVARELRDGRDYLDVLIDVRRALLSRPEEETQE